MPRELVRALRVNISDMRPWEYDQMSADDYEQIAELQHRFREAQRLWPSGWNKATPASPPSGA